MSLFTALHNCIDSKHHYKPGAKVELKESSATNSCKPITIEGSSKMLALELDRIKKDLGVFCGIFNNSVSNLNKISDYCIFYSANNKVYAFICELKSSNTGGAITQLYLSKLFIDYVVAVIRNQSKCTNDIVFRGIVFCRDAPPLKGCTSIKPLTYKKDDLARIDYAYLKCGGTYPVGFLCN